MTSLKTPYKQTFLASTITNCPTGHITYLPDTRFFLLEMRLDWPSAQGACAACRSKLVEVDGKNIWRIADGLQSAARFGGERIWITSWYEMIPTVGQCPQAKIDGSGGLVESAGNCDEAAYFALCDE